MTSAGRRVEIRSGAWAGPKLQRSAQIVEGNELDGVDNNVARGGDRRKRTRAQRIGAHVRLIESQLSVAGDKCQILAARAGGTGQDSDARRWSDPVFQGLKEE